MNQQTIPDVARDVPHVRPELEITESTAKPFDLDLRELPWWFIVPEVGQEALCLSYDEPGWTLSRYTRLRGVSPAVVHHTKCVRIDVTEWERPGVEAPWTGPRDKIVYARMTDDQMQWLAIEEDFDGVWNVLTFQDKYFDEDFGNVERKIDTSGRMQQTGPGSYEVAPAEGEQTNGPVACGMFDVRIGANRFQCLRVWEVGACWQTNASRASAYYLTREGRTVLARHYRAPDWAKGQDWINAWTGGKPFDQAFPDHERITINGTMLVHWHDDLTDVSLGT